MKIVKADLHKKIEEQLTIILLNTSQAAMQAHATATHEENKAENKYDTLGLEAAYLAEGQSKRVAEFEHNLQAFRKLKVKDFSEEMEIGIGALVCLNTGKNDDKYVFLSPVAGGVEFHFQDINIMLISESSPLGKALKNSFLGDDIIIRQVHHALNYEISGLW
jgi:transcription elongation GreA/GreB family factor